MRIYQATIYPHLKGNMLRLWKKQTKEQGFSLTEMMVALLIFGILSAIAVPSFLSHRKTSIDTSVSSDVGNFATQIGRKSVTSYMLTEQTMDFPSKGTTVKAFPAQGAGFCVIGVNPSGDKAGTAGIIYDSDTHQIGEPATACKNLSGDTTVEYEISKMLNR